MTKSNEISPKTTEQLEDRVSKLEREKAELELQLRWYKEQFSLQQKQKFGRSSEKTDPDQLELPLFNEAEQEQNPSEEEATVESITYERKKNRKVRKDLTENLPTETVEYILPAEDQVCSCCNGKLHTMKQQVKEELEIIPAEVKVKRHVKHVYSCRNCEKNGTSNPIVTAPAPEHAFPGSLASPSAVSYIIEQKFVQGTPLYRQEQALERLGVPLSRQTMSNWLIQGSEQWLEPIYDRMADTLKKLDILHADETTVQVLKEDGREASSLSYMWLYRSGLSDPPIILYDYKPGRASKYPRQFLSGFEGFLHVDGYSGYNSLKPDVTLVGCWAHARRKFVEAEKSVPDNSATTKSSASEGLAFINQLYQIEKQIKKENLSPEEVYEARQKRSKPVLEAYLIWLKTMRPKILPKSLLGKAINYSINQMDHLRNYLEDGRLEIDNNRAERSIKPFVIGRKNWIFSNTSRGAKSSSVIYSIIETAKENGLKPQAYLAYLFEKLPNIQQSEIDDFLPWSESLPEDIRITKRI